MTCARCGAQNPDGNLYCQSCGMPLAAAAAAPQPATPPGPPPGMAPPAYASPPSYASPFYAPAMATPPVHRTPWMVIIAAVVALVVVMTGFGTALAVLNSARNSSTDGGGGIADLASPSPETSPSPVASPIPTPTSGTQSNDGESVTLPAGWSVTDRNSETLVLSDPNDEGEVTVASGASSPAQTAQDNKSTVDSELKGKYPDTRPCPGTTTTNASFNGAKGIDWTLCLTLTDGTNSVPAAASIFAGANSDGSVYYVVIVVTRADDLSHYLGVVRPVLATVHWKLA